jgi:hypothetical protein
MCAVNNLRTIRHMNTTQTAKDSRYTILRNPEGERAVKIMATGQIIPADIAGLCAGKDAWISQIQCKCRDCGELFALRDLQGNGQWCEECQTKDME